MFAKTLAVKTSAGSASRFRSLSPNTLRRNSLLAGGLGAALLLGGSTYALWSATDTVVGGQITAGDLNVEGGGSAFWDISEDRADVVDVQVTGVSASRIGPLTSTNQPLQGHLIADPETWRMVPGDEVAVFLPFGLTLEGDNLVAALTMDASSVVATKTFSETYLPFSNITYSIYDVNGNIVLDQNSQPIDHLPLASGNLPLGYFQAPNGGQQAGTADQDIPFVNPDGSSTTGDIVVALFIKFDAPDDPLWQQGRIDTQAVLDLSDHISLTLQQVRCGAVGGANFVDVCS